VSEPGLGEKGEGGRGRGKPREKRSKMAPLSGWLRRNGELHGVEYEKSWRGVGGRNGGLSRVQGGLGKKSVSRRAGSLGGGGTRGT